MQIIENFNYILLRTPQRRSRDLSSEAVPNCRRLDLAINNQSKKYQRASGAKQLQLLGHDCEKNFENVYDSVFEFAVTL